MYKLERKIAMLLFPLALGRNIVATRASKNWIALFWTSAATLSAVVSQIWVIKKRQMKGKAISSKSNQKIWWKQLARITYGFHYNKNPFQIFFGLSNHWLQSQLPFVITKRRAAPISSVAKENSLFFISSRSKSCERTDCACGTSEMAQCFGNLIWIQRAYKS